MNNAMEAMMLFAAVYMMAPPIIILILRKVNIDNLPPYEEDES